MHPTYSIIFFTTASGAGYGLLACMGIFPALGLIPQDRWLGLTGLGIALGLVSAGLLSSTFHLGHPERAWRAFSQWRSSWLAREGVIAVLTYIPAGLFAIGWVWFEDISGIWGVLGLLSALAALLTVICTAMIYASIKAIPKWHNPWVPANYLLLGATTGALLFGALLHLFGAASTEADIMVLVLLALAAAIKAAYRLGSAEATSATVASATGLGRRGRGTLLDPPHTRENFLLHEMGYRVARKHAAKLCRISDATLFALPLILTLGALLLPPPPAAAAALLAALSAALGVVIERWLFFAEATHAVMLYYGEQKV